MAEAIALAERGLYTTHPNPRVGSVVVSKGELIGAGFHQRAGEPHAERLALAQAGERAHGATLYVTLEPCCHSGRTAPCSDAVIAAGVARVVIGMRDPNPLVAGKGIAQIEAAGIAVTVGVLEAQAAALNPGFISRMTRQRPYVRCKLAMSLDGRTAMANGESQWISSEASRFDVQGLRARSEAILTGIGTVLADDPQLTVRTSLSALSGDSTLQGEVIQPLRVIMDANLRTPESAQVLQAPGNTLILTASTDQQRITTMQNAGAEVQVIDSDSGRLNWQRVLRELAQREVNDVLLEAGATLAGSALQAGVIDELIVYIAPHLMGDSAKGLLHLPGLDKMQERVPLVLWDMRQIGPDIRLTYGFVE
jgi:diaminohydroxyphosphoribosylaminopyrimidine deaminase/5-amino-6-(5-phosphoribosylamino)uracil reductase